MDGLVHSVQSFLGMPAAFILACISAIASTCGIMFSALRAEAAARIGALAALFGGVILTLIATFHLLPTSFDLGWKGVALSVTGFLIGIGLETFGHKFGSGKAVTPGGAVAVSRALWIPLAAISLHSFLDGMVYVASLEDSHSHGAITGFGLILHEIPEGVLSLVLGLMIVGSLPKAILIAVFAASLTTPMGAALALMLGETYGETFLEIAFPLAAGFVSLAALNLIVRFGRQKIGTL